MRELMAPHSTPPDRANNLAAYRFCFNYQRNPDNRGIAKERCSLRNRKETLTMAAVTVLILAAVAVWMVRVFQVRVPQDPDGALVTMIDMNSAPADVRQAAELLETSRVGYAMGKPDRTYLIIATGEQGPKVKIDRAEGQPAGGGSSLVDVFMKTADDGHRLMIATARITTKVDYQFNLDGAFAGIPTLVNQHNLPLVHLDEAHSFSVITPAREQLVTGSTLHVTGFARVFEGAFRVAVTTADGRELGTAAVHTGAGAPSWASFTADVAINTTNLPESGFVIFEGDGPARVRIPVRFR
jgi:hypothetical protein